MVNVKELRLLNWVVYPNYQKGKSKYWLVRGLDIEGDKIDLTDGRLQTKVDTKCIEYIPLTQEMLLKCGFIEDEMKDGLDCYYLIIESAVKSENRSHCVHQICIDTKYHICYLLQYGAVEFVDTLQSVKYLHQLQSLYFALTGEELEVSL